MPKTVTSSLTFCSDVLFKHKPQPHTYISNEIKHRALINSTLTYKKCKPFIHAECTDNVLGNICLYIMLM